MNDKGRVGRGPANGLGGLFLSFCDGIGDSIDNYFDEADRKRRARIRAEKLNDFRAYDLCPSCLKMGFFPIESVKEDKRIGGLGIEYIVRKCTECDYEWKQT